MVPFSFSFNSTFYQKTLFKWPFQYIKNLTSNFWLRCGKMCFLYFNKGPHIDLSCVYCIIPLTKWPSQMSIWKILISTQKEIVLYFRQRHGNTQQQWQRCREAVLLGIIVFEISALDTPVRALCVCHSNMRWMWNTPSLKLYKRKHPTHTHTREHTHILGLYCVVS